MLRIQVIMQDDLKLFCDPEFVKKLKFTLGEGGHEKEARVLEKLAEKQYGSASAETMLPGAFESEGATPDLCFVVLPTKQIGK